MIKRTALITASALASIALVGGVAIAADLGSSQSPELQDIELSVTTAPVATTDGVADLEEAELPLVVSVPTTQSVGDDMDSHREAADVKNGHHGEDSDMDHHGEDSDMDHHGEDGDMDHDEERYSDDDDLDDSDDDSDSYSDMDDSDGDSDGDSDDDDDDDDSDE